jgi:hypothetical protein
MRFSQMSTALTCIVTSWICLHPHQLDPGLTAMVITYSLQVQKPHLSFLLFLNYDCETKDYL